MIKKFGVFTSESVDSEQLLYYAFDWDDNILYMPTMINLEKKTDKGWEKVQLSTSEFAKVRGDKENYRLLNNSPVDAFSNFRDNGPEGPQIFLKDVKLAVSSGKFGPSWKDFVECLTTGTLFAIITARGHESDSMRLGVEWLIDNVLTEAELFEMYNHLVKYSYRFGEYFSEDYPRILKGQPSKNPIIEKYLKSCEFIGVSAPSRGGSPSNPEKAKEEALLQFIKRVNDYASRLGVKAKIGFSDDDTKNVDHIEDVVDNLSKEQFPSMVEFTVKGTQDPKQITKKVKVFETQSSWSGGAGDPMSASIMPFKSFNTVVQGEVSGNLAFGGSENRQDAFGDRLRKQTKFLSSSGQDITKSLPKNKDKKKSKKSSK